jgi:ATP-dependent DNA ligase
MWWTWSRRQNRAAQARTDKATEALYASEERDRKRDNNIKADDDVLRFSDDFEDPLKLLEVAQRMHLEGFVSKRRDAPYRSRKAAGWTKTKTATWRAANRERYKLFEHS